MTSVIRNSAIDWTPQSPRRVRNAAARLGRDIGIAVVASVLANLVWNSLPAHQNKISAQIPAVVSQLTAPAAQINAPTADDMQRAAQFEQMALAKLSPLKPEADLVALPAAPLVLQPLTLVPVAQTRPDFAKPKSVEAKMKRSLPVANPAEAAIPALYYAPEAVAPETVSAAIPLPPKPSLFKRIVYTVPGTETAATAIGGALSKSADFVGGLLPRF